MLKAPSMIGRQKNLYIHNKSIFLCQPLVFLSVLLFPGLKTSRRWSSLTRMSLELEFH